MSARAQSHPKDRRNRKSQTPASRLNVGYYIAPVVFLLVATFGALAASSHASKTTTPANARTSSSASDDGDYILAPNNLPSTPATGDFPPLPIARSAQDPNFHPVKVQHKEFAGDRVILTCFNPETGGTEIIIGKRGRDTVFTFANPKEANLPTGEIQNIQPGNLVATRNPNTGQTEYRRVVRTYRHLAHETITVRLADAMSGKIVDSLTATPEHPFFVPGRGAIPLGQLGIGTQVTTRSGPQLVIASLVKHEYPLGIPVYNFEVQGDHTYFVGRANGGTWVHNTCTLTSRIGENPYAVRLADRFQGRQHKATSMRLLNNWL